jgi:hypothetical protein
VGFTRVDPDELDAAAGDLGTLHDDLVALAHPIARHARLFGEASEVPELQHALERFAAAASTMTREIGLQVHAAQVTAKHVAAAARRATGG